MKPEQAKKLGRLLRVRRRSLGLTARDLAKIIGIDNGTIIRLEQGAIAAPAPDKLSRMADALGLGLADVFALATYVVPDDLPNFSSYLRTKYRHLPASAIKELERAFELISKRHGLDP